MASFVLAHLMNRVMDSIEVELLCERCELFLACTCAVFGINTHLKVLLCAVRNDFAEELCELCRMLCLFKGNALVSFSDFREAFAVCLTAHRKVHADFGTLAREVLAKTFDDARVDALCRTDMMLICELKLTRLFDKLVFWCMADRAFCRRFVAFINITANGANKLFHMKTLLRYNKQSFIKRRRRSAHCRAHHLVWLYYTMKFSFCEQ